MSKPTMVIVMEGGLIQDIFVDRGAPDATSQIVIVDRDASEDQGDGRWCEEEDADVFEYGTAPLSNMHPEVLASICKHLELELPDA